MSAVAAFDGTRATAHAPRIQLLGTGTVGRAFVARCLQLSAHGRTLPALAAIMNSRGSEACAAGPAAALGRVDGLPRTRAALPLHAAAFAAGDIVVDATASDAVAARHADWLARGAHVVTANKLGNGADLLSAQAIARAQHAGGAQYGDAATVGAGLPLLRAIRELVAGGDRIHAVEGVLSGSLAWLFDRYDGARAFSAVVREARAAGYTEPDPRIDLPGEDVRRKLLILARAAGLALEAHEVRIESLLGAALAAAPPADADAQLASLDAPLRARFQQAGREGARLRFVGRFVGDAGPGIGADPPRASVGLRALPARHPLCGGSGTDNRVAIFSDRYREQPLVIQGPGAGVEVTAAALLDDVLRIAATARVRW